MGYSASGMREWYGISVWGVSQPRGWTRGYPAVLWGLEHRAFWEGVSSQRSVALSLGRLAAAPLNAPGPLCSQASSENLKGWALNQIKKNTSLILVNNFILC